MKSYHKPMFYMETFELMEHIAGDCTPDFFDLATHRGADKGCGIAINGKGQKPYDLVFVNESPCNFYQTGDLNPADCYQGIFTGDNGRAFAS